MQEILFACTLRRISFSLYLQSSYDFRHRQCSNFSIVTLLTSLKMLILLEVTSGSSQAAPKSRRVTGPLLHRLTRHHLGVLAPSLAAEGTVKGDQEKLIS